MAAIQRGIIEMAVDTAAAERKIKCVWKSYVLDVLGP
jgi:hypothetical protein